MGKYITILMHVLSVALFYPLTTLYWKKECNPAVSLSPLCLSVCRYQYYLQLKKDVLEGRISCSLEQAIRLASLAVQGTVNWLFALVFMAPVVQL